jgi:GR25 family glycosyltransferase involved in LPS biosynthesis
VIAKWALSCFVIGDDKKRKIVVLPNLHKFGFKPKIIAPNFFDKWPVNFSRERSLALTRRSLSLGELGCAQSHLDCYKTFLDSNSHLTLIFEDDAFLSDQKLNEFKTALKQIEILEMTLNESGRVYTFFTESAIVKNKAIAGSNFLEIYGEPSGALCYVVNRRGAEALIIENRNLDFQADWPRSKNIDYFLYYNKLISHGNTNLSHDSLLDFQRKSLNHSKLKKFYLASKSLFFVTYVINNKYYESWNQYLSINVLPVVKWRFYRFFSQSLENWPKGVRKVLR